MARIRTIKPEFFLNESVASLPYEWRLLFVGLWTQADREGRLEDRPMRLKAELFPYDDLNIDQGLGCLANASLITRYERGERRLIMITNFSKHQKPHEREAQSLLPEPLTAGTAKAVPSPTGREGKGTDQGREGDPRGALLERFEQFWAEYPRKVAKDAARKEWLRSSPDAALMARMIAKVREHKASPQWRKDNGEFIPHARTWLHQKRWEDDPTRGVGGNSLSVGRRWYCPHVDRCCGGHATACKVALMGDPDGTKKWPLRPGVVFEFDEHGVPVQRVTVGAP